MKERLITLFTALAALALTAFLLSPPQPPAPRVSLPTSEDRGNAGLKGLYSWLQREGVPVASLRNRYSELPRIAGKHKHGHLLLVSLPAPKTITKAEWQALHRWLEEGNSLLVLGAVYWRPDWAQDETCFCEVKKFLDGFSWLLREETAKKTLQKEKDTAEKTFKETVTAMQADVKAQIPQQDQLLPVSDQPLLRGVKRLETQTVPRLLDDLWKLSTENHDNLAINLLQRSDGKGGAFWLINAGAAKGQIFLSLAPDLFSNARLGQADNAQFFANLLGQALGIDGKLIFDDYHFGLTELYDPEHFFKDSRLHQTLGFLGLLWLLYVIGYSDRLAPVRAPLVKLSARDFIEATAGFFARRLQKRMLATELVKHLLLDIRFNRQLRDEQQAWAWLERHPQIAAAEITLLRRADAQRRISLTRLANAIIHIRMVAL